MTDYNKLTKSKLVEICREKNIHDYSKLNKGDLIKLLQNYSPQRNQNILYNIPLFLNSIASNSKFKYKRVDISPLRYAGGKSRAVGWILEYLPQLTNKLIVSPFVGGGSVELTLSSLGYQVMAYDIFDMLINFWSVLKYRPQELIAELGQMIPDKEHFTRYRHILLNYWEKIKPSDLEYKTRNRLILTPEENILLDNDPIKQASYYFYNHQLSYGPMFLGWPSSIYLNPKRYSKILSRLGDIDLTNIDFQVASFEDVIPHHKDDFLFLDPPYYLDGDSKMFKGMYPNCNFAIHHNNFNHQLLKDLLSKHTGGFILTYNDCNVIREWYSEYQQIFPEWQYTYGQGETRIGKNRQDTNIKESHEIIIICPPK